jgi:hypothetical protein
MAELGRRITPRFKLRIPLAFHRVEGLLEGEHQADAVSISTKVALALPPKNSKRKSRNENQRNEAL